MHTARGDDVVRLSGLLDARRAAETRQALYARIQGGDGDLVVDLTEVESIDATVMTVLGAAAVRLHRMGRHVVLRGCRPALRRLFAFRGRRRLFVWERDEARDENPDQNRAEDRVARSAPSADTVRL
jgi:anti-anti-sigma factor